VEEGKRRIRGVRGCEGGAESVRGWVSVTERDL
jgi:hypothetical protein